MKRLLCRCLLLLTCLPHAATAGVSHYVDPRTGLSSWKAQEQGFSLELMQILPDYVRAVYASRGLPSELIERVVKQCVFGTIVRNESDAPLSYRVADWGYLTPDGVRHALKTKSEWVREWRELGVAYRWSMLPDAQTFEVGDWGQGFSTVDLPPGSTFDLVYSWRQHEKTYSGKIEGVRCAPAHAPSIP
jgi:hypothetical protein